MRRKWAGMHEIVPQEISSPDRPDPTRGRGMQLQLSLIIIILSSPLPLIVRSAMPDRRKACRAWNSLRRLTFPEEEGKHSTVVTFILIPGEDACHRRKADRRGTRKCRKKRAQQK
jgi:hypothetical protein